MRRLAFTFVLLVVLLTPVTAAADVPPSVVAACQAEYVQLGPAGFAAKYGAPETFGNCVKAHTTTQATSDDPALAACKADYLTLGAEGFVAKYGKDALGQCVRLHTTQKPQQLTAGDPATSVASAFCQTLAKTLGKDAFLARYGPKEAMGNCVKASLVYAKSLFASCRASSGSSKDAFKACLAAGLQPRRR